jgi:hypothetical protein
MTTATMTPVTLQTKIPPGPHYQGDWIPLLLTVTRPSEAKEGIQIRDVTSDDAEVQLDLDVLDREMLLNPGESYRLTMPIRVRRPKVFGLGHLMLRVQAPKETYDTPVRFPATAVEIRHAIGQDIAIDLEPLCAYDDAVKVLLTLHHTGPTLFRDLTVSLQPAEAIRCGKPIIQLPTFESGKKAEIELIIDQKELDVTLTATVDGQRPEARKTFIVGPPPRVGEQRFRFLEPRRLSTDHTVILHNTADGPKAVECPDGVSVLDGDGRYLLIVRPQHDAVSEIRMRTIPNLLHVTHSEKLKDGAWKFSFELSFGSLLRRPEIIYYDVESRGEHLTGEVPVCIKAPGLKHWQVAGALGVALTVQGIAGLARFLHHADYNLTALPTEFSLSENFNILFLASVPLSLALIKLADWVQYKWQS